MRLFCFSRWFGSALFSRSIRVDGLVLWYTAVGCIGGYARGRVDGVGWVVCAHRCVCAREDQQTHPRRLWDPHAVNQSSPPATFCPEFPTNRFPQDGHAWGAGRSSIATQCETFPSSAFIVGSAGRLGGSECCSEKKFVPWLVSYVRTVCTYLFCCTSEPRHSGWLREVPHVPPAKIGGRR